MGRRVVRSVAEPMTASAVVPGSYVFHFEHERYAVHNVKCPGGVVCNLATFVLLVVLLVTKLRIFLLFFQPFNVISYSGPRTMPRVSADQLTSLPFRNPNVRSMNLNCLAISDEFQRALARHCHGLFACMSVKLVTKARYPKAYQHQASGTGYTDRAV